MGHTATKPGYDMHIAKSKLQESMCEGEVVVDIVTSLSLEHHISRIVIETSYLLVNVKTTFKYMD